MVTKGIRSKTVSMCGCRKGIRTCVRIGEEDLKGVMYL